MTFMQGLKDNAFDLCIADPPYGIGATTMNLGNGHRRIYRGKSDWDADSPDAAFFREMMRVSRNQIVWGANHFVETFHQNSSCWVVWDKGTGQNSFADCELAWTSFEKPVKKFFKSWVGSNAKEKTDTDRIHPTQKPIALYEWLIKNYAPQGGVIFDPMMGSQSSRIAAWRMGFDYVGCELDEEYFREGCKRFDRECKNEIVLTNGRVIKQLTLFDDE